MWCFHLIHFWIVVMWWHQQFDEISTLVFYYCVRYRTFCSWFPSGITFCYVLTSIYHYKSLMCVFAAIPTNWELNLHMSNLSDTYALSFMHSLITPIHFSYVIFLHQFQWWSIFCTICLRHVLRYNPWLAPCHVSHLIL